MTGAGPVLAHWTRPIAASVNLIACDVLRSAVLMARQALVIGRRLSVAANRELADNASSAVVGSEMLRERGLGDLVAVLKPRRVR